MPESRLAYHKIKKMKVKDITLNNHQKNRLDIVGLFREESIERKKVEDLKQVIIEMQKNYNNLYQEISDASTKLNILKQDIVYKEAQILDYEWKNDDLRKKNALLSFQLVETVKHHNNLEIQIEEKTKELDYIIAKYEKEKGVI